MFLEVRTSEEMVKLDPFDNFRMTGNPEVNC